MIIQGERTIGNLLVVTKGEAPSLAYAKRELEKYLLPFLKGEGETLYAEITFDGNAEEDEFTLSVSSGVTIFGGKRGVIYGVYEFLESLGFRFFTPDLERVPGELLLTPCEVHRNPKIKFRDVLDLTAGNREWSLKNRLNSNLWGIRGFTEEHGGGYEFADVPAHSLTGEFLLKPFTDTHPEYFSLVGGKRHTGRDGQVCATNHACAAAVAEEIKKLFRASEAQYAALSQGDNHNYCECMSCRAAYRKEGKARVYFGFINEVASLVKKEFPSRKLVTFAYEDTAGALNGFTFESNVTVQYCTHFCRAHAAADKSCPYNADAASEMKKWADAASSLWIWDYVNCFRYELFLLPQYDKILDDVRLYARNKAEGVFCEGAHKYTGAGFAGVRAYLSYLLARAMWNPDMKKEEWEQCSAEFLSAYFGDAAECVSKYFALLSSYLSGRHFGYNFTSPESFTKILPVPPPDKREFAAFLQEGYALLERAKESAPVRAVGEIEMLYAAHLYHELFFTMEEVTAGSDEEKKKEALRKNKELLSLIKKYKMKITFWGVDPETQQRELSESGSVPPSRWNYRW